MAMVRLLSEGRSRSPESMPPTFGDRLRCHREAALLTRPELAELAGLSTNGISDLERGKRRAPRKDTVRRLAEALGLKGEERAAFFTSLQQATARGALDDGALAAVERGPYPPRTPRDLPPQAPDFVGHEEDLHKLRDLLQTGQPTGSTAVAICLVGIGGVGKSSLAAEALHRLEAEQPPAFPGGITWVRCDERVELAGLIWIDDQLLAAWGAPLTAEAIGRMPMLEEGVALRERALWDRLRPAADGSAAPVPALVVLDNVEGELPLERLLDTLRPLGVTALLTMRGEPPSRLVVHLLRPEVLAREEAIKLFAERYAQRGGEWSAERDASAAAAIAETLGGLPLAIVIVAACAACLHQSPAALAEELHGPELLTRLSDPFDPTASVRYSLDKTLNALTSSQRACFAALGLPEGADWAWPLIKRLVGGVSAASPEISESYQAGRSPSAQAHADLQALIAYSLVGLVAGEGSSVPRVRPHPVVRELAREEWARLPAAEQKAALQALLAGVRDWLAVHQIQDPGVYLSPPEDPALQGWGCMAL
jgi:transcriptional regulator with XRE-family HTH domain